MREGVFLKMNVVKGVGPVAVIGANGFVGSRLIEVFHLDSVCRVVPIVRHVTGLARLSRFDIEGRFADIRNSGALARALGGCEVAVDCSVGMPRDIEAGASSLVVAAARAGVRRVVYLSSASVHGQNPALGTNEDTPLSDRQEMPYNNAKVRAERQLLRDAGRFGIEVFILRPSIVFGPRDRWITSLSSELRRGQAWLVEQGRGICNTIYVDNLVEAIRRCIDAPRSAASAPYLVTDAEAPTWRDVYEASARALSVDFGTVHHISAPRAPERGWTDRMQQARVHPLSQELIRLVPRVLKRVAAGTISALQEPHSQNPWVPQAGPEVKPSREMVLLQQCRHRFPMTKAVTELGYVPLVHFEEGMKRTFEWMRWAES